MKKNQKEYGYIGPNWRYIIVAMLLFAFLLIAYVFKLSDHITLPTVVGIPFSLAVCVLLLIYEYSTAFYISSCGIIMWRFGIKVRHITWEDIDQIGTGYTSAGTTIVITLKNHKRFTPFKESGRARDADIFSVLYPKGTILIRKSAEALPFIEQFYGSLDYVWHA